MERVTRMRSDVSVVTTLFNEADGVIALLDSILGGTASPAEVVVADGGSDDGTLDLLDDFALTHPEVRVIKDSGGRSAGRNAAIGAASNQTIVCIDGGCIARADWLERIIEPFENGARWVGGFYEPKGRNVMTKAIGLSMVYVREEAEGHFMPSARSMAFDRELWKEVGGFPEDVQFGEDTVFADSLMLAGHEVVFVPGAIVDWTPPLGLSEQARTMFAWGEGDGLKGLRSEHYKRVAGAVAGSVAMLLGLAAVEPRLIPLAAVPLVPVVRDHSRLKYRHMQGWTKWVLIPIATLNGLVASLLGFLKGRTSRKRAER